MKYSDPKSMILLPSYKNKNNKQYPNLLEIIVVYEKKFDFTVGKPEVSDR